jgi:uncharacterized membrane protein YcjF (UPF0283 family)
VCVCVSDEKQVELRYAKKERIKKKKRKTTKRLYVSLLKKLFSCDTFVRSFRFIKAESNKRWSESYCVVVVVVVVVVSVVRVAAILYAYVHTSVKEENE